MGATSISAVNMLYSVIEHSVLFTDAEKPNGKLCKYKRPLNSVLEDVVINGLALVNDDVYKGTLDVNIYVPNLVLQDPDDHSQPDIARLEYLSALGNQAFEDGEEIWEPNGEYCLKYQQDVVVQDENNQYYVNFKIEFYSENN